jgi:hypothetical protein
VLLSQVGDTWFTTSARELLANVDRDLGDLDAARRGYADSLRVFVTLNDQLAQVELLEDVATLASREGAHEAAIELASAIKAVREELGSPMAEDLEAEHRATLQPSVDALGEEGVANAMERGRTLGSAGAVELALEVCAPTGEG